jgi:TonB-linked SusC/RagA family outer membrane protein
MLIKAIGNLLPVNAVACGKDGRIMSCVTKTLRVMKLTSLLLMGLALQLSARSYSQTVTYTGKNVSLETVFGVIEKQTGYVVFYDYRQINGAKPVTLNVRNEPLGPFLERCFKEQPFGYAIEDKTIMITRKEDPVSVTVTVASAEEEAYMEVTGRVVDSLGNPLVGASVIIQRTKKGVQTDGNGMFILREVNNNSVLLISFSGYESRMIKVNGQHELNIMLSRNVSPLDVIQVIAYGTTSKRLSTGDVTTVTAQEIERQPVGNLLMALSGRVPGLNITETTGVPGAAVTVAIRGKNSISSGNDPFYVVDGVPYPSQLLPNMGYGILNQAASNRSEAGSPLSYLNPSDIESISVLKDADATAIYGSRAANGAILITTKKGKAGDTKVDFNLQNGWGRITRPLQLMNTQQYLEMRHEALRNDGRTVGPNDFDLNGVWDTTRYTDWQKVLMGGTSQFTHLTGTVSGGNATTTYLIGTTYHRETTVFPGNFDDKKGAVHFNVSSGSLNQKFKVTLTGSYMVDNNHLPNNNPGFEARILPPDAPAIYNPDGSLNWAPGPNGQSTLGNGNALAYLLNTYSNKATNLVADANFSYQLLPGLEIRSNFGYNNLQTEEMYLGPLTAYDPAIRNQRQSGSGFGSNNTNTFSIEPELSYRHNIARGKLEAFVAGSIQQNNARGQQVSGSGYTSDALIANLQSAANIYVGNSTSFVYRYAAMFGRVGYTWDDKYLFNFSGRRDGSSRFGSENQFQNFGSVGLGWVFSKEHFFSQAAPAISFGKIRASYGSTGSDQIGNYQFLSLYSSTYSDAPYQGLGGLLPNGLANPFLQWELTKKAELGLELGFFKDRILLTASYYRNRTNNELLSYTLPLMTGFGGVARNLPATVQNMGGEFVLSTVNIRTSGFSWTTTLNVTIARNKLVSFPNMENSSYANDFIIGKSITSRKVWHATGVNDTTGVYQFASSKGGNTYSPNFPDDRLALIDVTPRFYGGIENTVSYKGFELIFMFAFKKQIGENFMFGQYVPGNATRNEPLSVLARWQKRGDHAPVMRFNADGTLISAYFNQTSSDAAFTDASFIRLKNLAFAWQMPETWRNALHLKNFRLFVQGQNLFTITKFIGNDPETGSANITPPVRTLTTGIQVTF